MKEWSRKINRIPELSQLENKCRDLLDSVPQLDDILIEKTEF
jgi:hypothetical protein